MSAIPLKNKQMVDGFPRRNRMDLWSPAEKAISDAVGKVEEAGAHPLLTEAVILLGEARDKVADFVELEKVPKNIHVNVKRTYWDEELNTIVFELENGRKLSLSVYTEDAAEALGCGMDVVIDVKFDPVDGV